MNAIAAWIIRMDARFPAESLCVLCVAGEFGLDLIEAGLIYFCTNRRGRLFAGSYFAEGGELYG